jgi:predicted RNA-binding Zn-ribbon protein involved in translation (DUF1610 family)
MMLVPRVIDASERFDATQFDVRSESLDHTIHIACYTCPNCGFKVRFNTNDLYRGPAFPFSNETAKRIENARPINQTLWERAFDFLCPGCKMSVRVIAQPGNSFAMGCYNWQFVAVIELPE